MKHYLVIWRSYCIFSPSFMTEIYRVSATSGISFLEINGYTWRHKSGKTHSTNDKNCHRRFHILFFKFIFQQFWERFFFLLKFVSCKHVLHQALSYDFFDFRLVHVGSAGVTRPERPGLDLSRQPPAVRLNKDLGFILTYKLKVIINFFPIPFFS